MLSELKHFTTNCLFIQSHFVWRDVLSYAGASLLGARASCPTYLFLFC